jgi:hypothetical protein
MTSKTHGSAAARLLALRVRIPQAVWMSVFCECCVLLVEASATGRYLVRGSRTECMCVCVCVCLSVVNGKNDLCTYSE